MKALGGGINGSGKGISLKCGLLHLALSGSRESGSAIDRYI